MAQSQRPSYRLNLNRNPTQKWAEAQSVDYEGDDWGDDNYDDYSRPEPEPVSAGPQRHPGWGGQGGGHVSQRSFTNPTLAMGPGRQSLDRDEERRHFSADGYDPRYSVQNTANYSQREGSFEHNVRDYLNQPPLQLNTEVQNQPRYQNISGSRTGAQADTHGLAQSAPGGHFPQQIPSPIRRDHQDASDIQFPQEQREHGESGLFPRHIEQETALSQEQSIPQAGQATDTAKSVLPETQSSPDGPKALPFPRPADIYKRVEEEREKERRSQESSRPSLDSVSERAGGSPSRPADSTFHNTGKAPSEEPERPRRAGPVLDTVDEREGEYGPSPTSAKALRSPFTPSTRDSIISSGTGNANRQGPEMRPASSVYTDRPDPVSASSITSTPFHPLSATTETTISESSPFDNLKTSPSIRPPSISYPENHTEEGNPDLPQFDRAAPPPLSVVPTSIEDNAVRDVETSNHFEPSRLGKTQTQPSHEYKSVVQQAFDAENSSVLSPSSTHETIPRSSTASTSDISPIIGRKQDTVNDENSTQQVPTEIAPKEPAPSHNRSGSVTTLTPTTSQVDNTILPSTTFVAPHRRDNKSPNFEETKVKRPLSVEIPVAPEAQHGVLSTVTTSATPIQDRTANAMHPAEIISGARNSSPPKQPGPQTALVPPPTSRTTSEDWQEWQAQRRHFNAKHGIQDSDTVSPAISSPISRSESPVKGTVKNIAGRIEGNSGRSSPVVTDAPDSQSSIVSKPQHLRNESFRPAIPGGWLSYTTSASGRETPESHAKPTSHPVLHEPNRNESTESIPTATAPRNWQPSAPGPIEAAFAAAAAAGSAMVGAFSGSGMSRDTPQYSEVDSDDDDSSVPSRSRAPEFSQTRDFATESVQTQPSTAPINMAVSPEASTVTAHGSSPNDTDNPVDFPAPLRTNKLSENKQPSPRISAPSMAATDDGHNPEQLQYDIVQSLTPKASRINGSEPSSNQTPVKPIESDQNLPRQASTTSTRDDILPQEYSSYWDEQYPSTRKSDHTNETAIQQTTPQTTRPPIPVTTIATGSPQAEPRPFLDQRYSWKPGYDQSKGSVTSRPAFDKGIATDRPSTPPTSIHQPPSIISPPSPIVHRIEEEQAHAPVNRDTAPLPSPSKSTSSSFPQAKMDFKQILSIKEPADRIRAFDENRRLYAQSSGLLEQWLSSMKTSEHADVFRTARLPSAQPTIVSNVNRPSPRREVTTSSGTKQMQEDGKRLLAAAGRVGTATKGFFGKTKDKLRNASSGEKAQPSNRRQSSSLEINTTNVPRSPSSALSETAPQIPTPALETPKGEQSFSMLSSTIDQILSERSRTQSAGIYRIDETTPIAGDRSFTGTTANATNQPQSTFTKVDDPPKSVIASLPGNNSSSTNTQGFPNYSVGSPTTRNGAAPYPSKPVDRSLSHKEDAVSKVSMETDRHTSHRQLESLSVPRERRPSSVSDVSDISATHDEANAEHHRTVSPNGNSSSHAQQVSPMLSQQPSKKEEAELNRISLTGSTLPAPSSTKDGTSKKRQSRIASGAQIVPVADLKGNEVGNNPQAESRPFSFIGSETLNHNNAVRQGLANAQANNTQQQSTKNVFPPEVEKSPQIDITEHPAYRKESQDGPVVGVDNPLPSARRSPQDSELGRQRPTVNPPVEDKGEAEYRVPGPYTQEYRAPKTNNQEYRIPGPYTQEYRSPRPSKPMLGYEQSNIQQKGPGNIPPSSVTSFNQYSGDNRGDVVTPSRTEQQIDYDQNKSRTLGGMFRTRSKSQTGRQPREQALGSTQSFEQFTDEERKRKGVFGPNNRSISPTPQLNDGRGEYSTTQDAGHGRKLSMDMLRTSTFRGKTQPEGKKKRTSGFSALFGKSGGKDRDKDKERQRMARNQTMPVSQNSQQDYRGHHQPPYQSQPPYSAPGPQYGPNVAGRDVYSQFPHAPIDNKTPYGPSATAYQETKGYYGPDDLSSRNDQRAANNWQPAGERPQVYSNPSNNGIVAVPKASTHQQATLDVAPQPSPPPPPTTISSVAPLVPVTRANRDISYGQERPYIPPVSKTPQAQTTEQPKAEMASHVKNLHKRSRSPRLGRPPSDEYFSSGHPDQHNANPRLSPDPANQLGMFNNKRVSPGGGVPRSEEEQEKPWIIGLPEGGEDDHSEEETLARNRGLGNGTSGLPGSPGTGTMPTVAGTVSPSMPHQYGQRGTPADIISPMTATEPRSQGFNVYNEPANTAGPIGSATHQGHLPKTSPVHKPIQPDHPAVAEQIPAPPSTRSALAIPNRTAQPHIPTVISPEQEPTAISDTVQGGNRQPPSGAAVTTASNRSSNPHNLAHDPATSQNRRSLKQAMIERPPDTTQTVNAPASRPLTVAEKVLGIQPTARGTMPEHRSTTPVPTSPPPSVGIRPKSTTWPEEKPSTTTMSTTNTGSTMVTTTTMRSSSKPVTNSVRTSTYLINPNPASDPPAGTNSDIIANENEHSSREILNAGPSVNTGTAPTTTPLAPTTANINSIPKENLRISTSPRNSTMGQKYNAPQHGKTFDAIELPGSRPDGYESEEEVVMSATAYPGQEWAPDYAYGMSWDE